MVQVSGRFSDRSSYYLVFNVWQQSQDIPNNRSLIAWELRIDENPEWGSWTNSPPLTWSLNIDGQVLSGSTTYNFNNYNSLVLSSGTTWVAHNASGSKSISFSSSAGGGSTIGSAGASGSLGLTTIPRASTSTFSGGATFDAGSSVTINTTRASTGFTHTIEWYYGDRSGTVATGVGASTTWAVPLDLVNQTPSSTSGTGYIKTTTYSGSTVIGTSNTTMTVTVPSSVVPTFTAVTCAEGVASVNTKIGTYVQSQSKLSVGITGAAGVYGSTITSYKIEIKKSSTLLQTIDSSSGTSNVITESGTITIIGTITDSRGRTATKSITVSVLAWQPPKLISTSAERALSNGTLADEGTYIKAFINASVSSLTNGTQKNTITYKISTKASSSSTWTVKTTATPAGISYNSNNLLTGPYVITASYDVKIEITDQFSTSTVTHRVSVASVFMHWDGPRGVGVNKYRENGVLDVNGDIYNRNSSIVEPVGMIISFAGGIGTPPGWLICDGAAVSRTTYSALFNALGVAFGAGNGSTTFNLPNLKGRVPVGIDSGQTEFNTRGKAGGAKTHTLTTNEMPSHQHKNHEWNLIVANGGTSGRLGIGGGSYVNVMNEDANQNRYSAVTGGGEAHNNLQPYLSILYLIKF